jgi:hypothetical protein
LLYENQSYISSHLTSKERHGLQKKKEVRENKRAKSSSVLKREREKKKVAMPSQKEAREGKLLKGVPLPPNIPDTNTS